MGQEGQTRKRARETQEGVSKVQEKPAEEAVWERFNRLPLSVEEKANIYTRIRDRDLGDLQKLIPPFLDESVVALSLKNEFGLKPRASIPIPNRPRSIPNRPKFIKPNKPNRATLLAINKLNNVRKGYGISIPKGKYSDWLFGDSKDMDPKNSGAPEHRWDVAVAHKLAVQRVGYVPGGPMVSLPDFEFHLVDPYF